MTNIEKGVLACMADVMLIIRRKCPAAFIYGSFGTVIPGRDQGSKSEKQHCSRETSFCLLSFESGLVLIAGIRSLVLARDDEH